MHNLKNVTAALKLCYYPWSTGVIYVKIYRGDLKYGTNVLNKTPQCKVATLPLSSKNDF